MGLLDWHKPKNKALAPEGTALIAIGDIHGDLEKLLRLIDQIEEITLYDHIRSKKLIFLGDYIDRGPSSKEVLDLLIQDRFLNDWQKHYLIGNHEQMFLDYLTMGDATMWLTWGKGQSTIQSYCPDLGEFPDINDDAALEELLNRFKAKIPAEHLTFLKGLDHSTTYGDYYFVHAGINPKRDLDHQELKDQLWIRKPFLTWKKPFEKKIVHGHTPVKKPQIHANRIALDTGAARGGTLSGVLLQESDIRFLTA